MKNYSLYILLSILVSILSGCAVTKKQAPIEYHHGNSALGGSKKVNESTIPIISNDGEVISSNLHDPEKLEIIDPKHDDENNVMPNPKVDVKQDEEINEDLVVDDEKIAVEDNPAKVKIHTEEEPKKLVQVIPVDYINPVVGKIITKFGEKTAHGINKGINILAPTGTKVVASASGKVIYADYDATFGNLVIIKLDNKNIVLSYAHLEDLMVSKGSSLKQGDIVGYVGSTGKVTESQLHFAMREGKTAVDPLKIVHY